MRISGIAVLALYTLGFIAMPALAEEAYSPGVGKDFPRNVYWGDTHVHSRNSADAFNLGNTTLTPDDAYSFARGGEIRAHNGMPAKLRRPLDFLVVADHAGYLGAFYRFMDNDPKIVESEVGRRWSAYETATERFADVVKSIREPDVYAQIPEKTQRSIRVEDVVKVADRNNAPGIHLPNLVHTVTWNIRTPNKISHIKD